LRRRKLDILKSLMLIICAETIILCSGGAYLSNNFHCLLTLLILNFFFITILYPLKGNSFTKAGMLSIGNLLGVSINSLYYFFIITINNYFSVPLNILINIGYPILTLMWIVPFWSLTLTLLTAVKKSQLMLK
jgi:hypothetical protein